MKKTILFVLIICLIFAPTAALAMADSTTASVKGAAQQEVTLGNIIPLYFDLMDFMRTEALGDNCVTTQQERQRVAALVTAAWPQLDAQTQNTLIQIAQISLAVKANWKGLSQAEKDTLKAEWKKLVLSPNWIYPPLDNPKTYTNGSTVYFNYPADWTGGEAASGGIGYLFLGENGSSASWEQVGVAASSPTGALYALSPVTAEVQGMSSMQLARQCADMFVTAAAPDMKVINSIETQLGAAIILNGHYPDQTEEKFCWIIIIPSGNEYALIRMGGPVSQADTLVPEFYNMLATLQWSKPVQSSGGSSSYSGGEAYNAFDTAWSSLSSSVVSNIWAK